MTMRQVMFVKTDKNGAGRSYEHLVSGAIDASRIVAVEAGGFDSRFDSTVKLAMDNGGTFVVQGTVSDWLDAEEQHGTE